MLPVTAVSSHINGMISAPFIAQVLVKDLFSVLSSVEPKFSLLVSEAKDSMLAKGKLYASLVEP